MRHALPLETTTEIWKALPQTDRWNCQPRRGVMLHSVRLCPSFIFPNYPLVFPFILPPCFTSYLAEPPYATFALTTTFKTLITIAFTPFSCYDSIPRPSSLYPGLYSYLCRPIDRLVGSCLHGI